MITIGTAAVLLFAVALALCVGRGIRIADERSAGGGSVPGGDVVPFEDDCPTVEFPALPPVPARSQHFTDPAWGRSVSQDLVDMEFDSFVAFVKHGAGGWVA